MVVLWITEIPLTLGLPKDMGWSSYIFSNLTNMQNRLDPCQDADYIGDVGALSTFQTVAEVKYATVTCWMIQMTISIHLNIVIENDMRKHLICMGMIHNSIVL